MSCAAKTSPCLHFFVKEILKDVLHLSKQNMMEIKHRRFAILHYNNNNIFCLHQKWYNVNAAFHLAIKYVRQRNIQTNPNAQNGGPAPLHHNFPTAANKPRGLLMFVKKPQSNDLEPPCQTPDQVWTRLCATMRRGHSIGRNRHSCFIAGWLEHLFAIPTRICQPFILKRPKK